MDDEANLALLALLLQSARLWNRPGDFAAGTFLVWTNAIGQLKALLPNASPPSFSSVDQNLLNAFINAAVVTPPEPLDQVVYNAQIAVLNAPGMQGHYELLLLIEIAVVARNDKTLSWQDVFVKAVENIGLTGLEPQLIIGWNLDMNVIDALVQQLRTYPDKPLVDAISDARGDISYDQPSTSELFSTYCGYEGFSCCNDPIDSCKEPDLLCDSDELRDGVPSGTCRRNLWPPRSAYVENETIPGDELDTDWTEEVQGLAFGFSFGSAFFYVVQGKGVNKLWKVPVSIDWTTDWGDLSYELYGIHVTTNDNLPADQRRTHWGDPDVRNGRVYVPMEDNDNTSIETNVLSEFDADTLEYLGQTRTFSDHAGSVAIHPKTGEFYIENSGGPAALLHVYPPRGPGKFHLGQPLRKIPLNVSIPGIGGIAFSPSGKLYVSGWGGVYAFQVGPNKAVFKYQLNVEASGAYDEPEGLTVVDLNWDNGARNQIHVMILVNTWPSKDNAWFKHIAVNDSRY